jgi:hypothetical protein
MERYSASKKRKNETQYLNQERKRAESTGGYSGLQEPSEIITSTNLRDLKANQDRTPSVSPSTIRTNNKNGNVVSNSLFYHNMFGESTTPMSSHFQTSGTPGIDFP